MNDVVIGPAIARHTILNLSKRCSAPLSIVHAVQTSRLIQRLTAAATLMTGTPQEQRRQGIGPPHLERSAARGAHTRPLACT